MIKKESASTGERAKRNIDDECADNQYDVKRCDFDVYLDMLQEAEERFLEPVPRYQIRDSDAVIEKAKFSKGNVVNIQPESGSLLQNSPDGANDADNSENKINCENVYVPHKKYCTIIAMVAGSLVGAHNIGAGDDMRKNDP